MIGGLEEPFDLAVVGGGPAGLAAAVAARSSGLAHVAVLEREDYAGGVLPQCVHDGFGLHLYGRSLTGPEYAELWIAEARAAGVLPMLATTVLGVERLRPRVGLSSVLAGEFSIEAVGASLGGCRTIAARSVVVATGCRERTRGQLGIPGTRPAGVLTAGTAQYMVNVRNQLPGDKAVVLGSGDIGLIMARRLTLEGAQVRMVLGQAATGLVRNHLRCIQDFGIPIRYGWGLASVHGTGQLKGVTVAPMLSDGTLDLAGKEYVRCNVLLTACGLIPEREVLLGLDADEADGLFVCGNANRPHDLADQVTQEGIAVGAAAAAYVRSAGGLSARPLPAGLASLRDAHVAEPKGGLLEVLGTQHALPEGTRVIACTACPTGCVMRVVGGALRGNACARGAAFARAELEQPLRLFTGTVKTVGSKRHLLPVRTSAEVPKDALLAVARACRRVTAQAPVAPGDVVCENVAGTGVGLVAGERREADRG